MKLIWVNVSMTQRFGVVVFHRSIVDWGVNLKVNLAVNLKMTLGVAVNLKVIQAVNLKGPSYWALDVTA